MESSRERGGRGQQGMPPASLALSTPPDPHTRPPARPPTQHPPTPERAGDVTTYCSRLPVHQDGSCNGLQHYAALGRDLMGGEAVNLRDRDAPQVGG